MPGPFKLAIIGCGKIAASHVEAALTSSLADPVAFVDSTPDRACALAERFNLQPIIARDLSALKGKVEGAIIGTPNDTHAAVAEECLRAGISVLVEKPLAISVAEGERIRDVARETNGTVAVGYVSRYRENVRLMATLLRERYFGRIDRFAYQFGTRGGWAPLSGYNLDQHTSGGGVLVTTGTHFIDRMLHWFGYPDEARLVDDSAGGPEANAAMFVRYQGEGLVGTARFSKTTKMPAGLVMETEHGTVVLLDRPDAPILLRPSDRSDLEVAVCRRVRGPVAEPPSEFAMQLDDFIAATREHRPPIVTVDQGLKSLRLVEELYRNRTTLSEDWYSVPAALRHA
jgi:predicted dehydrogenase